MTHLPPHLRLDRPAPECRHCGKPLRRTGYRYYSPATSARGTYLAKGTVLNDYTGRPRSLDSEAVVIRCVVPHLPSARRKAMLTVWFGEHGPGRDGFFCGPTCGYRWAVKELRSRGR